MLLLSERLSGMPILSLQTGAKIAVTGEPIIDPRRMHVVAFYCNNIDNGQSVQVLHTDDIRELSNIGIIIDSSDDIMSPDDLVRLQEIIEFNFELLDLRVIDTTKHKLGKVSDYTTESDSFQINKFTIRRPLLQTFNDMELIIDRSQVVEVNHDYMVVSAPTVEVNQTATQKVVGQFENPFSQPKPQTENR